MICNKPKLFYTIEVHCHNTRYATNQNYFIQQVSKKQFLVEELLFGKM